MKPSLMADMRVEACLLKKDGLVRNGCVKGSEKQKNMLTSAISEISFHHCNYMNFTVT